MPNYLYYTPDLSDCHPDEVTDWASAFLEGLEPDADAPDDGSSAESGPSSNTGITITSAVYLDWLAFTIPGDVVGRLAPDYAIDDIMSMIALHAVTVEVLSSGLLGYSHSLRLDGQSGARVGFGGQAGTIYVSLSSDALAYYVNQGLDWRGWLIYLRDLGVKFTRCDFAFDDHDGVITLDRVRDSLGVQGDVRLSRATSVHGGAFVGRGDDWTVYLGARTSQRFIRIYNKAAERYVVGPWVRVELEVKGFACQACMLTWINSEFSVEFLIGYLRSTCDFRVPSDDKNVSRWRLTDWWARFCRGCTLVRVSVAAVVRTVATVRAWAEKSLGGVLGVLAAQYGFDYVRKLARVGLGNLSPRNMALLRVGA